MRPAQLGAASRVQVKVCQHESGQDGHFDSFQMYVCNNFDSILI